MNYEPEQESPGSNLRVWLLFFGRLLIYAIVSALILSFTSRLPFPSLTTILGLFIGWFTVANIYMSLDFEKNILTDLFLFFAIVLIGYTASSLIPLWCNLYPNLLPCQARIQPASEFVIYFSMGISSFSFWLWARFLQKKSTQ